MLGHGYTLIRREYPTPVGPVDLLCRDESGAVVAVEVKRRGEIDGVEQLTRYVELLTRDPMLGPVTGVFAAQQIKPQARTLADGPRHQVRGVGLRPAARHGRHGGSAVLSCRRGRAQVRMSSRGSTSPRTSATR